MAVDTEITLRIVLEKPPKGVEFGLQKGRGDAHEPVQRQISKGGDLKFEFSARVKAGDTSTEPTLLGDFVQGPPRERFVYIDIGTAAGQADSCWTRRLKVPLRGITAKMIAAGRMLETRVPGTGRDGSPSCASVKEFAGWTAV